LFIVKLYIMRKMILLSFIFLLSTSFVGVSVEQNENLLKTEFCEGFDDGFCEGYKDVKGQFVVCPVPPVCPVPGVGLDNYKGGYNTGFKAGQKKAYNN